LSWIIDRILGS